MELEPPPNKLMELIGEMAGSSEEEIPCIYLEDQLDTEICRYKGEEHTNESPLSWWNNCKRRYPLLSRLAKQYLAILATSVPCERIFSAAGPVVNDKKIVPATQQC